MMIKSKHFWTGAVLLAVIPFIMMDVPKHYVDWTRDVHDEMIYLVQGNYSYNREQKAILLDNLLQNNSSLMGMMYIKSFIAVVLLFVSMYFFYRSSKQNSTSFWKALSFTVILVACSVGLKLLVWTSWSGNENTHLLDITKADTTLTSIYNKNFKGKVLYVDFWGTTCGPCLQEFKNFTKPLKAKYHQRKDIAYLYICGGRNLVWKQQLKKYQIDGYHMFLDSKQYENLYRKSVNGNAQTQVFMPRYIIINKRGQIVNTNAPTPSSADSIANQLDKYLAYTN
ncbi:TlpA family protein disulfide reductase [Mucilaginibacter lacusdianchii]|uniref:TlpA family protein disulfide reductase n=1 Tax=Mucilaginibacter lacusdianchii TaxID=2684211 RepID=UPI00131B6142|nr:TlpA disulfide reductase family protein [Mucilaginibacter sp. JXJ CY 39]